MQLSTPFNARLVDPTQMVPMLPLGRHPVVIVADEIKGTKAGDGGFLLFTLKITDGPNLGQSGAYRINLYNKHEKAREIAERQLSALCHVIGVLDLQDTAQLRGRPFIIEVEPQTDEPKYTEVKRVYDINGNEPSPIKNAQTPQNQPSQNAYAPAQQAAPNAANWGQPAQQQAPMQPGQEASKPAWMQGGETQGTQQTANPATPAWGRPS